MKIYKQSKKILGTLHKIWNSLQAFDYRYFMVCFGLRILAGRQKFLRIFVCFSLLTLFLAYFYMLGSLSQERVQVFFLHSYMLSDINFVFFYKFINYIYKFINYIYQFINKLFWTDGEYCLPCILLRRIGASRVRSDDSIFSLRKFLPNPNDWNPVCYA